MVEFVVLIKGKVKMFKKIAQNILKLFSSRDDGAYAKKMAKDQAEIKRIGKKAEAYIKLNPSSGPAKFEAGAIISERFWDRDHTHTHKRNPVSARRTAFNLNQSDANKRYGAIDFERPTPPSWTDDPVHKVSLKRLERATVKAQEYAKKNFKNSTPEIVELTEKGAIATWSLGRNREHSVAF